ncbi:DUF3305 domain-containing protein [Vibrio metschnikovii]|uniref:DUF3305 domain-containing protein n=1 Tax=Vibrio metschnikovii TaxID=28172 RepID=A0A9X0R774_VIBME|nr:DUF3305 domain-containing protein [Vibrio metschnikovii]MBC5850933.1 DUF3305 domain-containing protein [Vibrio metschnikovii]
MAFPISHSAPLIKNEFQWSIGCLLHLRSFNVGRWVTSQWQLSGFELMPQVEFKARAVLELFRDERSDYRFNLSSREPKLFVIVENSTDDDQPKLVCITASQGVAARYMDSDYVVLSEPMPLAVQAWIEAFIGREGELLDYRSKKRKGAGRSCGN